VNDYYNRQHDHGEFHLLCPKSAKDQQHAPAVANRCNFTLLKMYLIPKAETVQLASQNYKGNNEECSGSKLIPDQMKIAGSCLFILSRQVQKRKRQEVGLHL
jgi:hypothetical protein